MSFLGEEDTILAVMKSLYFTAYPVHTSTTHLKLVCQEVVLFTTVSTYADFY